MHIGSTILNEDTTFFFCYFEFHPTLSLYEFVKKGKKVIENHKNGIKFEPKETAIDLVHCSTLPWVSFTGLKHARRGDEAGIGIPKIVFGKLFDVAKAKKIPFSVEAHHALLDGLQV